VRASLRSAGPDDHSFMLDVYASARADELALLPWEEATKRGFVEQQFRAREADYRAHHPHASDDVIEVDGEPAGRLFVDRRDDEIQVVDIALLPAFRGRGVGTMLLDELIAEADAGGRAVTLHVEASNPARSLYDRLGFGPVADGGVYLSMARPPRRAQAKTAS
jgi:ribosomal protein S18 acetylase RimI-like enzyme